MIGWCGVPAPVSRILHDDDFLVLDRNAGIQCIAVPSHTRGHVLLYQKQLDTAFSGDSIQGGGIALTTGIYVFPLYDSVENYLLSLRKIGDLQAKYVCTGHCGILDREQTESALNESKQFVDTHSQYLLEVLRKSSGPLSLHELAAALHESYY
ncbi:MAG: Zn-dependent hydrolase, glyoxylase, partial [Paenibacillaceae bacterium]|nr:Zn-dependent hydrolase, glyoxylase [Paenibacillaceae bacterium]